MCAHCMRSDSAHLQVSYTLVFFLEYFGPFLIYPFFWSRDGRALAYGIDPDETPRLPVQDLACFYWCLHYGKVRSTGRPLARTSFRVMLLCNSHVSLSALAVPACVRQPSAFQASAEPGLPLV